MKKSASSGSGLFLLEMMISILFFSIAAAVCAQVFVKAHLVSEDAVDLNMAAGLASSAAEVFIKSEDMGQMMEKLSGSSLSDEGRLVLYYDEDWVSCTKEEEAARCMEIWVSEKDRMRYGEIVVSDSEGKSIYELSAQKYIPLAAGEKVTENE